VENQRRFPSVPRSDGGRRRQPDVAGLNVRLAVFSLTGRFRKSQNILLVASGARIEWSNSFEKVALHGEDLMTSVIGVKTLSPARAVPPTRGFTDLTDRPGLKF